MQLITKDKTIELQKVINKYTPEQTFVLFDTNTARFCKKVLFKILPELEKSYCLVSEAGDQFKTIDKCILLWERLTLLGSSRNSLLINVGGGMISDLGGFCASNYKRGIDFINIPTTLMGMVDASIGGKTAVNFKNYKNQIGTFAKPVAVFVYPQFLETLARNELHSGLAEMIKHQLLFNPNAINEIVKRNDISDWISLDTILQNIKYKQAVVKEDFTDQGLRQSLNFGHTIGHAIESLSHERKTPLLHGEAIILGMLEELKLSEHLFNIPKDLRAMLEAVRKVYFPVLDFNYRFEKLIPFLQQDKKNDVEIRFSLLEKVAQPKLKVSLSLEELKNVLA